MVPTTLHTFAHARNVFHCNSYWSKTQTQTKRLYSHTEANTYDYIYTNFENKSGTYDFGIHLPMKHMYSIAIIVAPAHKPTKEKQATAEASTYDYNDFNFENKSRTHDVANICP